MWQWHTTVSHNLVIAMQNITAAMKGLAYTPGSTFLYSIENIVLSCNLNGAHSTRLHCFLNFNTVMFAVNSNLKFSLPYSLTNVLQA